MMPPAPQKRSIVVSGYHAFLVFPPPAFLRGEIGEYVWFLSGEHGRMSHAA